MPESYFTDMMGIIWVQPDGPNTQCYPLACHDMGDLDAPLGDVTTALCLNANRQWETVNRDQGAPSAATTTIETWLPKTRTWLQKQLERRCPLTFYVQASECPPDDVITNYDVGKVLQHAIITSHGESNMVLRRGEEGATPTKRGESFDINAMPNPPLYWKLEHARRSIAEDEPLRDVAFCTVPRCQGPCGPAADVCDAGVIVADAAGGVVADTWYSADSAATWTALAGPFGTDEDIATVVCFPLDRGTTRVLVGSGTAGAAGAEVGYSDNMWTGAGTWSAVITLPGVAGDLFVHSGGLFALDQYHIWGGTDDGTISFSSDGGATWTAQAPVNVTPDPIYYVHFIDFNYGWAVGDNRWMNYTTDGGNHWALAANAGGSATDIYTCVATIDRNRVWVGGCDAAKANGVFWYSDDAGAIWTDRMPRLNAATGGGTITDIGDVMFYDEFAGAVVANWNDGSHDYKGTFRTYNGGYDWEFYYDPNDLLDGSVEHFGGNAVWICDYNRIVSVGEVSDSTGLIEDLTAAGSV